MQVLHDQRQHLTSTPALTGKEFSHGKFSNNVRTEGRRRDDLGTRFVISQAGVPGPSRRSPDPTCTSLDTICSTGARPSPAAMQRVLEIAMQYNLSAPGYCQSRRVVSRWHANGGRLGENERLLTRNTSRPVADRTRAGRSARGRDMATSGAAARCASRGHRVGRARAERALRSYQITGFTT